MKGSRCHDHGIQVSAARRRRDVLKRQPHHLSGGMRKKVRCERQRLRLSTTMNAARERLRAAQHVRLLDACVPEQSFQDVVQMRQSHRQTVDVDGRRMLQWGMRQRQE